MSRLNHILENQIICKSYFMINEIVLKKSTKTLTPHFQIMNLKEIYYNCWLIQEKTLQISGLFLLIYFLGYIGQLMYLTFIYIKIAILEQKFFENLLEIIIYCTVLNIFTVFYFVTSHKIHSRGLKISGLIHQIAQNAVNDTPLVESIKLFSAQLLQQPMNHINIFGIFYFDRSNINGVRNCLTSLR